MGRQHSLQSFARLPLLISMDNMCCYVATSLALLGQAAVATFPLGQVECMDAFTTVGLLVGVPCLSSCSRATPQQVSAVLAAQAHCCSLSELTCAHEQAPTASPRAAVHASPSTAMAADAPHPS